MKNFKFFAKGLSKMRVTNNMLSENLIFNLNENLKKMEFLQYQQAKQKKFRVPSDDPIGASKSLKFNTDLSKIDQYYRNAKDAYSWMNETEAALTEISEKILPRAYELATQMANDTYSDSDLLKVSEEVKELKNHLIQIANTTYAGRHIFSGYKTDEKLLNDDGTYNISLQMKDENSEGGKKAEIFEYNVGVSETVKVNTLGGSVFGVAEIENGTDFNKGAFNVDEIDGSAKSYLIDVFDKFEEALGGTNGAIDKKEIQKTISRLQGCMDQTLAVRSKVGARMRRLELTQRKLEKQDLNTRELLSYNEDADMTKVFIDLKTAENVYRASLAVGARIIQPSLVDFLR